MINRDGNNESLWQHCVNQFSPRSLADHSLMYDVIIAGGGITGVSTALSLQEKGYRCIVLEASNLCFGTTGGTTSHITTFLDTPYSDIAKKFNKEKAELVANSVKEAISLIKNNIERYHIDCEFSDANAYIFSGTRKQDKKLEEISASAIEAGVANEWTDSLPIKTIEFRKAIKMPGQAKFNPLLYVYGLAAAFEKAGGVIVEHCRVTKAEETDTIKVETSTGQFYGKLLIYATHTPPGMNLLHLRCTPYRSYALAVTLEDDAYPVDLIYDMVDPYHYYRTQVVDGQPYLIGGGLDHKTGHDVNTENCMRHLEVHLRSLFNIKEVVYKWSSQYFEPADGIPYIGHLPGSSGNILVAAGYGGDGIVYSHVAASLFADLISKKENPYIKVFDPNRIKPVAGFKNFVNQNANVAKQLFHKWLSKEELEQFAELAPDEAKVVSYQGEKIAIYKDTTGDLYALHSKCTHMGCEVQWNNAEKSWDCPCHGARYSVNGEVLTGPTTRDLTPIKLSSLVAKE